MDDLLLVIDDEPAFLDIVRRVAQSAGCAVATATAPAVFRTLLRSEPPSLVLLDLQMPDADGIEILHDLADVGCRAKIFLMSGFDPRVLELARGIGQDLGLDMGEPLHKPLRPAELRHILLKHRARTFLPDAAGLRAAIDLGQLELFYQPLVTLETGQTVGFEGLVRWRHPEIGIIMPGQFIDLAERWGLIMPLTERVLDLAAAQIAIWQRQGIETFVSVNISAANIVPDLPQHLARLCARHGIPHHLLRLELTETAAMGHPALMLEILTRIRLKGFQLAIDDFGTGYSSLVQLHRLPFSELKIDQSFVREMPQSAEARLIVGVIVTLAHSLKLELIAEGIETEDMMRRLIELGCETGQGYLFSRPMPAGDVVDWLAQHPPRPVSALVTES